jgi:hypothetical protein
MPNQSRVAFAVVLGGLIAARAGAQFPEPAAAPPSDLRSVPAETTAAAVVDPAWDPPRTSWGHPSFEGVWSTDDMRSVPLSRPASFGTRETLNEEEFLARARRDEGGRDEAVNVGDFLQHEWGVRTFGYTSIVVDPPTGQLPGLTEAGEALAATRSGGTFGPGPFNALSDFTLYDRCITRGVLGSLLPVIYGNGVRITQSPEHVSITYEMIHDTRIIPLDGRAPLDDGIRQWMGTARGHFEGDTLVIETANFTDRTNVGTNGGGMPNSEALKLTERLTRVDPEMIEYVATVNDPVAHEAPFTLRVMITARSDYSMYEYSCHEGNGAVAHSLSGERLYEKQVAEAVANGQPIPERATEHGQIRNANFDELEIFNINAGE